jgi:hypothetical protein
LWQSDFRIGEFIFLGKENWPDLYRRFGIVDADRLHNDPEKIDFFVGMSVRPIERRPVFIANLRANPDDNRCVEPASISQKLTQMAVIRALELILDDLGTIGSDSTSRDIAGKVAHSAFNFFQLEIKPESLAQQREVLRQPGCKVSCFVFPKGSRVQMLQLPSEISM